MPAPTLINFSQDRHAARPRRTTALAVSAGLTTLFFIVYPTCNWIASQRQDVPTLFFAWERSIPFIPVMLIPYMSIDLFFVAGPFVCGSYSELRTFAIRMVIALLVAAACFLTFPLQFGSQPPEATGILAPAFGWLRAIDGPFNLFPSMHIAFCGLLIATYGRHSRGVLRVVLILWFALIIASAVLTYQHHLLDVAGGFALAGGCVCFVREETRSSARADVTAASAKD